MQYLLMAQVVISLLITLAVALQSSTGGLGASFGSSGQYHTKRGIEKSLFAATIILAVLFTLVSITSLILPQ